MVKEPCAHSRCRRRLRRDVHRPAPPAEAEAGLRPGRRRDHRGRPRPVHDVSAVPARSRRRLHLPAPCGRTAAPRPRRSARSSSARPPPSTTPSAPRPSPPSPPRRRARAPIEITYDELVLAPGSDLPHPPDPRPRRLRHRLQDRRGGHRPAQPRHRTDGHRLLHPRPRDPRRRPDLRLRRRRLRGRRGARPNWRTWPATPRATTTTSSPRT